ncbi:MMPL family transporter [Aquabacterium sp.]|uniref:MMPL family transporter n=1 Tax=Aquabacterium sp. TaxID=1872578 RepID=UPI0035B10909
MSRRTGLTVAAWLLSLLACALVIARTPVVADLSAFMPKMPTARQQLLMDQFRDGIIARLIMVGIEGADPAERARLSLALGQTLRRDPAFLSVQNGDAATDDKDRAYFFEHRYLLSPGVQAQRFSADGLHAAIQASLNNLGGSAGMLLKRLFLRDPTGETLSLIEQFNGDSQPPASNGAWTSRDGQRALLLLQTRAAGSDTDAQARAIARIHDAFNAIPQRASGTRLVMSGTGVFSVSSRATIEREVAVLASASTVLVVTMLLLVYRSIGLLLLGLVPVVSAAAVGVAAVGLIFGQVHGLTLAFGTTLVGEAVDYAIYLFLQRATGQPPDRFWRTIRLGVLTSLAGFLALTTSGFPGLAQLGVYAVFGLVAAALVTRFGLPGMMPAHLPLRDLSALSARLDRAFAAVRRQRGALLGATLAAVAVVAWPGHTIWSRQLTALNPVPKAAQDLDVSLRNDLGAPDMRFIASLAAPDEQAALEAAERASVVLRQAVQAGELAGFKSPTMVLPSLATQRQRQAALPEPDEARRRLDQAMAGLPVRAERLQPFIDDLAAARRGALLTRRDLAGSSAAMLVDSLLVQRAHDVLVLLPLQASDHGPHPAEIDTEALSRRLRAAGLPQATVIDILAETSGIFSNYLNETLTMSMAGSLVIVVLLLASLRSWRRTLRVVLPLACTVCCVAATLVALGHPLTILHLVGLLLVVAVGSNYALFFDGSLDALTDVERHQTHASLLLANLATVGTYGLLGLSSIPVLSALGSTVALGTFLALILSAALAGTPGKARA